MVSEFTDRDGNIINVPIYINEHAQHNRVFIDVNKISTVYGKRNFRDYISKQLRLKNLVRIKNRSTESSERSAPIAESYRKDASVSSIRNPNGEVNTKFDEAQKTVETKTESEPVANDDNGDVIPFDVEQEDVQNSVSTSQKNKKCSKKSIVKTFRNGQNAKGEFMANVLIDLADLNSEWWTGGYNYDMLGVSKTDDTEFRQFHQEIEKRTKDMDEYGKSTQPAVSTSFTIHDGSGKEYIYRVLLDGYLHGVVLGKIDKAKYDAFVKKYEGGETHGRTIADTVRRVSRTRTELGRKDTGSSWGGKSDGNSGSGRVAGVSPQRDNGGNDSGGQSTNHPVSAVTELNDTRNSDRTGESISNRTLLANALESTLQGDLEQKRLAEYRELIPKMEKEEQHLNELNAKIRELSFAKGPRDKEKIRALREDAIETANRINIYDKQLLRLEASKPLQNVLLREKKKAYDRAKAEGQNAMREYKSEAERKQQDIISRYQESRKKAVTKIRETAEKRDAKAKLQKLVLDTVKWISYPSKTDVKCPDILKQPYADFLNGIDLSSQRLAKGGDPTKADLRLANAMGSLATALERVMASQDPNQDTTAVLDTGYLDPPANFVQKLRDMTEKIKTMMVEGDYVVNNMSAAEVRQLSQMIRTLNHCKSVTGRVRAVTTSKAPNAHQLLALRGS